MAIPEDVVENIMPLVSKVYQIREQLFASYYRSGGPVRLDTGSTHTTGEQDAWKEQQRLIGALVAAESTLWNACDDHAETLRELVPPDAPADVPSTE